ncbi:MAG: ribonuclease HIII [Planctomycetes bacterium]|nr:ribonuclease HIII [Planctomycetota bacterium]
MNETRVFTLTAAAAERLAKRLREALPTAEWRNVAHARFAVKADGANLVCYSSGKVVVQGRSLESFCARFLADGMAAPTDPALAGVPFDGPTVGSDESGKGDYFGPLVVAAVFAEPTAAKELAAMGVADSKTLTDLRMFPMAERIERTFDHEVRELPPIDYNTRWNQARNVNHVLADLHVDAIAALLSRHPGGTVIVDRFGDADLIASRLRQRQAIPGRLIVVPRAEAHPVVAAASIVARVHFLEGLKRCAEDAARDLHKGAGTEVDQIARAVFRDGGEALLRRVAKLHFANSSRIMNGS